jgi:hypothetical protein
LTSTTGEEEPFTAEQTVYDRDAEPLGEEFKVHLLSQLFCYPLANEVAKGYSNATVRPSVTSL